VRAEQRSRPGVTEDEILGHADALYNLARYLTARASDAEDLVQETFVRAFSAAPRLASASNLKAWLFKILRNVFHDNYRREKKHRATESLDEEAMVYPELRGDAELEALRVAAAREIEAAIAKLGDDGRTVLLLDLEGFTETEIAEIVGCALGTVKSRLMRSRASLREQLSRGVKQERA
jgi:RNA polymerase sigma-70 factor (ECF subfamily)